MYEELGMEKIFVVNIKNYDFILDIYFFKNNFKNYICLCFCWGFCCCCIGKFCIYFLI